MKEQTLFLAHFDYFDQNELINMNNNFLSTGWTVASITQLSEISNPNDTEAKLTRVLFVLEKDT